MSQNLPRVPTHFILFDFPSYLLICRRVTTWLEINLSTSELGTCLWAHCADTHIWASRPRILLTPTCRNMPKISRPLGAPRLDPTYRGTKLDSRGIFHLFSDSDSLGPQNWWHAVMHTRENTLLATRTLAWSCITSKYFGYGNWCFLEFLSSESTDQYFMGVGLVDKALRKPTAP